VRIFCVDGIPSPTSLVSDKGDIYLKWAYGGNTLLTVISKSGCTDVMLEDGEEKSCYCREFDGAYQAMEYALKVFKHWGMA
jgi:hypothetical protein